MSEQRTETVAAKVRAADVGFEDHGIFTLNAGFDDGTSQQGLGHIVDLEYIKAFIRACGVSSLHQCIGRIVQVDRLAVWNGRIVAIRPMPFEPGEPFDILAWEEARKARRLRENQEVPQ